MDKAELVSTEEMGKQIPTWLIGLGGSLMFISIFVNSIGFNLMAVNSALTQQLISTIEAKNPTVSKALKTQMVTSIEAGKDITFNPELLQRILILERKVAALEKDSHAPASK